VSRHQLAHGDTTEKIIGAAYEVYNELGFGFLESVYEKALAIVLAERGLRVGSQIPIDVYFHGVVIGQFRADLLVDELVIVEIKSVQSLVDVHEVQLVNYLVATGKPVGLLINFGRDGVEVRRKIRELPS